MPDAGSAPGIYPSRPKISIDGREDAALRELLRDLFVEETVAGLYRCEATFLNWGNRNGGVGFLYFGRDVLEFGKTLKIEMGAGDAAGPIFEGKVTGLEGRFTGTREPELLVLAEDRLQDLRMTRRTRTFEDASDADVVRRIASAHGLRADVDFSGPTHRVVAQVNQSDLALARERARAAGAELWVEGDTLKARPRTSRNAGTASLTFGQGLIEFAVTADLANQATGFTVAGWDVAGKRGVSHRATDSVVQGERNGGDTGGSVLSSAIGSREQQVVHDLPVNGDEARALAEAHYARAARRFVVGNGVAEGDARLKVGAEVELKELGPLFEGKYHVTRVRHTFDLAHGFRTAFTVERAALGRAA
ncbi:MAG TPA: contractile injection system protein, VgrG/Pvc8 family [Longimicrobium sp.]|nr:contractile injection system protein, VgrG/Pvc8 family [Longimicrobium sp.]